MKSCIDLPRAEDTVAEDTVVSSCVTPLTHISWQTPVACGSPSSLFQLQQLWSLLQSPVLEHGKASWAAGAEGFPWEDATAKPIATSNAVPRSILPRPATRRASRAALVTAGRTGGGIDHTTEDAMRSVISY